LSDKGDKTKRSGKDGISESGGQADAVGAAGAPPPAGDPGGGWPGDSAIAGEAAYLAEAAGEAAYADSRRFEAIIEGLLFAAGEAIPLEKIAAVLELKPRDAKTLLDGMAAHLASSRRGLLLRELSGKYQLCTRPEIGPYLARYFDARQKHSLSQAAYETLSIIAYNTAATRVSIEKIRGVNSDSSVEKLLEKGLIAEIGRLALPGRPMAYDVTDEFYRCFGFKSKKDLPAPTEPPSPDEAAGSAKTAEPDELAGAAGSAELAEAPEYAETAESAESARPNEATGSSETAESDELARATGSAELAEAPEYAETAESAESARPNEAAKPVEVAGSA
jgi:segregation and condensation protein B